MIVAVPGPTAEIVPPELTVATAAFYVDQVASDVTFSVPPPSSVAVANSCALVPAGSGCGTLPTMDTRIAETVPVPGDVVPHPVIPANATATTDNMIRKFLATGRS